MTSTQRHLEDVEHIHIGHCTAEQPPCRAFAQLTAMSHHLRMVIT